MVKIVLDNGKGNKRDSESSIKPEKKTNPNQIQNNKQSKQNKVFCGFF